MMGYNGVEGRDIMRKAAIIAGLLALTACGETKREADPVPAKPMNPAFTGGVPAPVATTYPQPAKILPGMAHADAPPDVARHIARQENCHHWRQERTEGRMSPTVTAGLERECAGLDAQLRDLRERYRNDGKAYGELRTYSNVE